MVCISTEIDFHKVPPRCPDVEVGLEHLAHSCTSGTEMVGNHLGPVCQQWPFPWPPLLGTKSRCQPTRELAVPHLWSESAPPSDPQLELLSPLPQLRSRRPGLGKWSRRFQALWGLLLRSKLPPCAQLCCLRTRAQDAPFGLAPGGTCGGLVLGALSLSVRALATLGWSHCPDWKCQQP